MAKRIDNDFYETPRELTLKLVDFMEHNNLIMPYLACPEDIEEDIILEPCNGDGSISKVLIERYYKMITNDIDQNRKACYHFDATKITRQLLQNNKINYDWVITNPPFNQSSAIVRETLYYANRGGAFLLRLSFLEPTKGSKNDRRGVLLNYRDNLRFIIPVNPRPQFRDDSKGTDSVTVAWFIYDKNFSWKRLNLACPFQFFVDWR